MCTLENSSGTLKQNIKHYLPGFVDGRLPNGSFKLNKIKRKKPMPCKLAKGFLLVQNKETKPSFLVLHSSS